MLVFPCNSYLSWCISPIWLLKSQALHEGCSTPLRVPKLLILRLLQVTHQRCDGTDLRRTASIGFHIFHLFARGFLYTQQLSWLTNVYPGFLPVPQCCLQVKRGEPCLTEDCGPRIVVYPLVLMASKSSIYLDAFQINAQWVWRFLSHAGTVLGYHYSIQISFIFHQKSGKKQLQSYPSTIPFLFHRYFSLIFSRVASVEKLMRPTKATPIPRRKVFWISTRSSYHGDGDLMVANNHGWRIHMNSDFTLTTTVMAKIQQWLMNCGDSLQS